MGLTRGAYFFRVDRETTEFMAECANLRHLLTSQPPEVPFAPGPQYMGGPRPYDLWEDRMTGGGGCRMVWCNGVVWITRHSGYAQADITHDVAELFREKGCEDLDGGYSRKNPHIYP